MCPLMSATLCCVKTLICAPGDVCVCVWPQRSLIKNCAFREAFKTLFTLILCQKMLTGAFGLGVSVYVARGRS